MSKTILFQTTQFSMQKLFYFKQLSLALVQFSSIWPIDRTLSSATAPGQSGCVSDGNEWVLRFLQVARCGSSR